MRIRRRARWANTTLEAQVLAEERQREIVERWRASKRLVIPKTGVVVLDPPGASFEWNPIPISISTEAGGGKGALEVPVGAEREELHARVLAIAAGVRQVLAERREPVVLAEDLSEGEDE